MKESTGAITAWLENPRARPLVVSVAALTVVMIYAANVERYAFLGDDAFITFRYAKNLAQGLGMVWNPGEFVEGYTNFLWVLMMSAGIRLDIAPEVLSNALGITSGLGVLFLLGRFAADRLHATHPLVWLPLFTLALSRSFTAWSTSGLATQFFTLLVLAAQLRFVQERRGEANQGAFLSSVLFAIATLTRPEAGLFMFIAGVFFLAQVAIGRARAKDLLVWMLPYVLIVGAHFLWRYSYYGDWLPNTFYAKVNGLWLEQAGHYFSIFQADYKLAYYLPLIFLGALRSREITHVFFLTSSLAYCAYLASIGGGRFEFRFLVVILPTLYWLIAEGIRTLMDSRDSSGPGFTVLGAAVAAALLLTTHLGSISEAAKLDRHDIESIDSTRAYANERARQGKIIARYIEAGVLPKDVMLCVGGAGALPYYAGWPTLDFRGLNDPHIARSPLKERGTIAHEHFASEPYMRERGVVVFDSLNNLVHEGDVSQYRDRAAKRGEQFWKLRAVRLGEHTMVFSTFVPEPEFQHIFGHLEVLF
jgi:arabinofuranosyltransferase